MVVMGTTVLLKVDSEDEALAWATVLRTLGLEVGRPSNSPAVSGDGRWLIRARAPEPQREQRHEGCTCTHPQRAS
jgi:hypothetical protein